MLVAALFFASGFMVSALGVKLHNLPLFIGGYGVLSGIGLGLGYISPVSTLIKWFPGSAGYGNRHGYYGLWGWGYDWLPIGRRAYEIFPDANFAGCGPYACYYGNYVLLFYAVWSLYCPGTRRCWKPEVDAYRKLQRIK